MKPTKVSFPIELVDDIASYLSARPYGEVALLFERMSACIKAQFNVDAQRNKLLWPYQISSPLQLA